MKKLAAFLALVIGLLPMSVLADSTEAGQKQTLTGNVALTGFLTATNLNPVFAVTGNSTNSNFAFTAGTVATNPFNYLISTNQSLRGVPVNLTGFPAIPVTGFSIECTPFNTSLLAVSGYPYNADTNGIAGGTITFHEYKPTGSAVTIGTLVLPSSAHGGPYVNYATTTLTSAYIPTQGSQLDAQITAVDGIPSQAYSYCTVTAVLQ